MLLQKFAKFTNPPDFSFSVLLSSDPTNTKSSNIMQSTVSDYAQLSMEPEMIL